MCVKAIASQTQDIFSESQCIYSHKIVVVRHNHVVIVCIFRNKNVECENTELISYACSKLMIVLSKLFV